MSIDALAAEFARLDPDGVEGAAYVGHTDADEWPSVGWEAGPTGHSVISIHPDDVDRACEALRVFPDGSANASGSEYDPEAALAAAGVRCRWHI